MQEQRDLNVVEALDFEEAKRLRDRINLMRGGATADEAEQADVSGLMRQRPGAMGLGTSQEAYRRDPPRRLPKRPDPMTKGHKPGGRRSR